MQLVALSTRPASDGRRSEQFERLLATVSSKLAALQLDDLTQLLPPVSRQVCLALNVDRGSVVEFGEDGQIRGLLLGRAARAAMALCVDLDAWRLAVAEPPARGRQPVVISRLEDLPMEAQSEREDARRSGLSTLLGIPVSMGDRGTCALVLAGFQRFREWPDRSRTAPACSRKSSAARCSAPARRRRCARASPRSSA